MEIHKGLIINFVVAILVIIVSSVLFFSLKREAPGNVEQAPGHAFNPFVDSSESIKNCIKEAIGQDNFDAIVRNERPSTAEESKVTGNCAMKFGNITEKISEPEKRQPEQEENPASSPVASGEQKIESAVPVYQNKIEFDQDLVISSGVREFSDAHLIFKGNVIVSGTGKLVISNARMDFRQGHNFHYYLYGKDNARIEFDNVYASTNGKWMLFDYRGDSSVKINNFSSKDSNVPWHGTGENAVLDVTNSKVGVTTWSNVTLRASDSDLFLELGFVSAKGTFKLPLGHVDEFKIEVPNDEGDTLTVDVKNSTFRAWGTTLFRKSDITFVDTKITIGIDAGADWSIWPGPLDPYVKVADLKAKKYDDFELKYDTNMLRLINTEVTSWYPQAFRDATVEISNSDLADVSSNGQNARLIIRNSTAQIAVARESVTYEFYDSTIDGDVVAQDNGKIYLYNTKVGGVITQKDNGKVYVNGILFQ